MTTPTNGEVALADRLVSAATATLEMFSIFIGRRLGLYRALTRPATVAGLSEATGVNQRYVREWLEQQAAAGLVRVDRPEVAWDQRVFQLDDQQRAVLVDATDRSHVSPLADMVVGIGGVIDQVVDAYLEGSGVPYASYGKVLRDGQAAINRPAFAHDLVTTWLGAVPGLVTRLQAGGRVADLACGAGWSTIALAEGLPGAEVLGYDSDQASIDDAIDNAAGAGATASFKEADASELTIDGPFDLILLLEALHDLPHPVEVLKAARQALAPGGVVLVADEKVAETFTAPGDELERMMYGWSITHCLPASMAEEGSAAIGTVLRPKVIREMAMEAGFGSFRVSEVDAGFLRLYVLSEDSSPTSDG